MLENECMQVFLNKVNQRCHARIACKLELMEPCTRLAQSDSSLTLTDSDKVSAFTCVMHMQQTADCRGTRQQVLVAVQCEGQDSV